MIFFKLSSAERIARLKEWNRWFAWFPVRVNPMECAWLCYVERRFIHHYYQRSYFQHRLIERDMHEN